MALLCAAALTVLAACGSSSPTSVDSDTATPSATATVAATATPSATATDAIVVDIDTDTTWQEVFDTFTASEQSCIRDELDDDTYESAMMQAVMSEGDTEQWDAAIFSCLDPDTARGLLLSVLEAGITGGDMGVEAELSEDERACLRERVAEIDVAAMFAASADGDDALGASFSLEMLACLPDVLVELVADGMGVNAGELSDDERECLREWVDGLDEDDMMVMLAQEDDASAAVLGLQLIACVPDLLFEAMADADEGADPPLPVAEETPVPLPTDECLANADAVNVEDDHANETEGATPLTVGEAVEGAIDYDVDFDFFVFEAEAGESYQIDVVPGTMWDPVVSVCDGEEELEYSDDYDGLAPRIYWEAPNSGPYYVKVAGWDEGTYTLTIAAETSS